VDVLDTLTEYVAWVSQRHVNPLGNLYGGYMLHWLVDAGSITAMKFAEGNVVLGFLDKTHFVSPVRLGDLVTYRGWVVNVRRSSIGVLVEAYVSRGGEARLATVGRMVFVKVDGEGRPVPVGKSLTCGSGVGRLCEYFQEWRARVDETLRREARADPGWEALSHYIAMPEDSLDGVLMYGGRLLFRLDEVTSIAALRFYPSIYVTASVNSMAFRRPIYVGDIVSIRAGVTYVGRTSVEVGFAVEALGVRGRRLVADGYFTFVNMSGGRPSELPAGPQGDEEARRRKEESVREAQMLKTLKPPPARNLPWMTQLL